MRDDYADNWEVKKLRTVEYDDLPDDYIIDEDGKMVVMPTEELYDDGSDEDEEDSSDEEEKAAFSGSADTRERRAVSDEFRRTGKGQGYDRLTTPGQVAAYRSSYGLGPANPRPSNPRDRQPAPNPRPSNPRDRIPAPKRPFPPVSMPVHPGRGGNDPGFRRPAPNPRRSPAPMPVNRRLTSDPGFRAMPIELQQGVERSVNRNRRGNDPGFRRPAPNPRRSPAPMPIFRGRETNDQGFNASKSAEFNSYLNSLNDEEFDIVFPNDSNEIINDTKWLFDTTGGFILRAVTGRRRKKKKKKELDGHLLIKSAEQSLRDPEGGLTAAGRKHFKETEGANLKPGVKGAADTPTKMRRKGSFLVRFFTNPAGPMVDPKGRPTRLALSARAWGEPVPQDLEDAAKLAAKGRRLLDRYRNSKEESKGQKSFEQFQLSMKSADMPGRSHGGIRPSMPSGSFTGSPGGTNRGRVGETGTITASGRTTQRVYSGGRKNSRSLMVGGPNPSSYSRDKYFLVNESGNHPYDDSKGEYESQWGDEDDKAIMKPMGRSNPNDGMIEPGNIDTSKRRAVKLPGGEPATVRSIGIHDNGKEVLIPTIGPRGENWDPDSRNGEQRARDHYKATGQHLGKFNSPAASDAAGKRLSQIQNNRLNKPRKAYNTTSGTMDSRERANTAEMRDINSNLTRPIRGPGNPGRPKAPSLRPRPNR